MVTWIAVNADGSVFEPMKDSDLSNCKILYNVASKLCFGCQIEQVVKVHDMQMHLELNAIKVGDVVLDAAVLTDEEQQRMQCMSKTQWHTFSSTVHRKTGHVPKQYRWYFTTSTLMPSRRPRYAMLMYHPSKELVKSWQSLLGQQ